MGGGREAVLQRVEKRCQRVERGESMWMMRKKGRRERVWAVEAEWMEVVQ